MVSETLSKADSEFQQGNFDLAASLYSEAVADFDQSNADAKELALVVQKLADSEYAQNKFDAAREAYSRLVAIQDNDDFNAKDKVSAYLKLAKSADKCEKHDDAEKYFGTAYALLDLLSAKHFLRKSVVDAYAEYLRARGTNAELLEKLEDELGIKKSDAEAKPVVDEVSPDSIPTPLAPKKPVGEEFVVLKTRLGKFSRKKELPSESTGDEKGPSVLEKKTDKTVEQEVAERKFLRSKGEAKDKGTERTSRRSSLRNAMSQTRGGKPDGDGLTNEPDIADNQDAPAARARSVDGTASGDFGSAPGDFGTAAGGHGTADYGADSPNRSHQNLPAVRSAEAASIDTLPTADEGLHGPDRIIDRSSLPQDLYPSAAASNLDADMVRSEADYEYQAKDLAKFVGRRPKRTLRAVQADLSQIAAPSLAVEAVSMPDATRSFLQQADVIKKSSDVAEPAPDVVPLRVEGRVETFVPAAQRVATTVRFSLPVIGLLILVAAGGLLLVGLAPKKSTGALPAFALDVVGRKFVTADGALAINVQRSKVTFEGDVSRDAKLKIWTGEWAEEVAILQGAYKDCRWLTVTPQGLKDQNGGTFYSLDAPERKTIAYAKNVSESAQNYFAQNRKFPSFAADLGDLANYSNPYSGKASPVVISSTVDNKRALTTPNSPLDVEYQAGNPFKGEAAGSPGAVHAISVSGQPLLSEETNTYTWQTQCFYVHGYDRNGKLIAGSRPASVYLLTDKNGTMMQPNNQFLREAYGNSSVCLTQTEKPKPDILMMKYLAILGGIFAIIGFVTWQFKANRYRG